MGYGPGLLGGGALAVRVECCMEQALDFDRVSSVVLYSEN
jgi:hypothetical protein